MEVFFFFKHTRPPPISHPELPPLVQKWPMTQESRAGQNRAHLCLQPPTKGMARHIHHRTAPGAGGGLLESLRPKPVLKGSSRCRGRERATRSPPERGRGAAPRGQAGDSPLAKGRAEPAHKSRLAS